MRIYSIPLPKRRASKAQTILFRQLESPPSARLLGFDFRETRFQLSLYMVSSLAANTKYSINNSFTLDLVPYCDRKMTRFTPFPQTRLRRPQKRPFSHRFL
jgi:hypothetical protein